MKVLLLTDGIYPYVTGGMQKHSFYLAQYLLKAGADLSLVHCSTQNVPEENVKTLFAANSGNLQVYHLNFPTGVKFPGHYLYRSYQYSKQVFQCIEKGLQDFDFIYIQGFSGWYLLNQLKKLKLRAKIITNFHGLEMYQLQPDVKGKLQAILLRKYVRKNLLQSPFVHSLGGKLNGILTEKVGLPESRLITAPIGIEKKWLRDAQTISPEKKDLVHIGFIGRNERRKGFPELMQALQNNIPNVHLYVVGPYTGVPQKNITWHGLVKDENKMMEILDQCDVLVCPSYAEGMPTVILEAMSRACAIAATDVGAVSEEVDSSNGWLFAAADAQVLEQTLRDISTIAAEALYAKKIQSLKKTEEKFLWDGLVNRIFK